MGKTATREQSIVVGKIRGRDDTTFVCFTVKDKDGLKLLDIRRYDIDGKGRDVPTIRGVAFTQRNLLRVRQYIDDALRIMADGRLFSSQDDGARRISG